LWGLLAVCAPAVGAAAAPTEVERYLDAAQALYQKLDYERGLDQARRAEQFSASPSDDVRIALAEGILLSNLARDDEADAAFRAALALRPSAELPWEVSPKIHSRFEAVRTEVRKVLVVAGARRTKATSVIAPGDTAKTIEQAALIAGSALSAGAITCWLLSVHQYDALSSGVVSPNLALQYKNEGNALQAAGWILAGFGAGALTAAGLVKWGTPEAGTRVDVELTPRSAGVVLQVRWP
jgi:tetratricopeptide (TPR) repeat protein